MRPLLLLVFLLAPPGRATDALVLELHGALRSEQTEHPSVRGAPGSVILLLPGGSAEGAVVLAPQSSFPMRTDALRAPFPFDVEAIAVTREVARLRGQVRARAAIRLAGFQREAILGVAADFEAERQPNGAWRGHWTLGDGERGTLTGREDSPPSGGDALLYLHPIAKLPAKKLQVGNNTQILAILRGGKAIGLEMAGAGGRATGFGNSASEIEPLVGSDGRRYIGHTTAGFLGNAYDVDDFAGNWNGTNGTLRVGFRTQSHANGSRTRRGDTQSHVAEFRFQAIGHWLWGEGQLDGETVGVLGHVGPPAQAAPAPVPALPPLSGTLAEALARRLPFAASALARHPISNRFRSPLAANPLLLHGGGGKQYDAVPYNAYAGANAFLLAERWVPEETDARAAACRAGIWLLGKRGGQGMASVYKTGFWWTAWQGMAFLDLHRATGDAFWLDRAREYADTLRRFQQESGTWTWVDPDSGAVGESFSRSDRSQDGRPLLMGEALLFLGRLRAAGVGDFRDVEDKALAWHRREADVGTLSWHSRRSPYPQGHPGNKDAESRTEAFPALVWLRYLLECREDARPTEIDRVLGRLEADGLITEAGVIGYEARFLPGDSPQPAAFANTQLAVIDLLRHRRFRAPGARERAEKLLWLTLASQEADTGLIDHAGRDLPGADLDNLDRLRAEMHHSMALRALTLLDLETALDLLAAP